MCRQLFHAASASKFSVLGQIFERLIYPRKKTAVVWITCVLLGTPMMVYSGWPRSVLAQQAIRIYDPEGRTSNLSREAIREIFFMRQRTWPDGTPIQVFVLPDEDPVHQRFVKEILGVYPFQLRAAWDRLVYSGIGQAPIQVRSVQEMIDQLQQTPGSIGYVIEE